MNTEITHGMIDFHSHILPEIDDGSRSAEESIAMLKMEAAQGIRKVIATPHFYADQDSPEHFLQRRRNAQKRVKEALAGCKEPVPEILLGAEVHYFSGISDVEVLNELTIENKKCILIEMPCCKWTQKMYHELEMIYINHGITPIIAHVDRYVSPLSTHGIPERLSDLPVLVQANAGFFLNRCTKTMALRMLRKSQIHLLGSDCHNLSTRPPRLGEAISAIQNHSGADLINAVIQNSQAVLKDTLQS